MKFNQHYCLLDGYWHTRSQLNHEFIPSTNQRMDEIFKACNWLWSIWNVSLLHTYCKKGGVKWHQWEFSKGFFVTELVNLTHRHSDTIKNPAGEENRHNHRATDQGVPEESGEEEKMGVVNKAMDALDHFSYFLYVFNVRLIQMTEMTLFHSTHSHPLTSLELNIAIVVSFVIWTFTF